MKGRWITVNGSHVFIENGQTVEEALNDRKKAEKSLNLKKSVINTNKTGMSFYDQLIPGDPENEYMRKAKNLKGEIVQMSPKEYFKECADKIFKHKNVEDLIEQRRVDQDSSELKRAIDEGKPINMPMINYAESQQEGLHRMMLLGDKYGWDEKFSVLKVDYDDVEYEKNWRNKKINKVITDVKKDDYYDKYEFIDKLKDSLDYEFKVEDKGKYCVISDNLVEKKVDYPSFLFDDLLDEEDLL